MDITTTTEPCLSPTATRTNVNYLGGDQVDEFIDGHDSVLLAVVHPMAPRCQRFFAVFEKVWQTTLKGSTKSIVGSAQYPLALNLILRS